jgi:hypothetical protein
MRSFPDKSETEKFKIRNKFKTDKWRNPKQQRRSIFGENVGEPHFGHLDFVLPKSCAS